MATIKNITKAFIGESQARNRYTFYAKIAKKEGYEQISEIFLQTAEHEKQHAKELFKLIQKLKKDENPIQVEAEAPTTYGKTIENIKAAIKGEHHETSEMYPQFAATAEKEGFPEIAKKLKAIGLAEKFHEERYKKILENLEKNKVFKKDEITDWMCRKCGYTHKGLTPPENCPSCNHATNYFEVKCSNI